MGLETMHCKMVCILGSPIYHGNMGFRTGWHKKGIVVSEIYIQYGMFCISWTERVTTEGVLRQMNEEMEVIMEESTIFQSCDEK